MDSDLGSRNRTPRSSQGINDLSPTASESDLGLFQSSVYLLDELRNRRILSTFRSPY